MGFPGGYCTIQGCSDADPCTARSSCWSFQSGGTYCLLDCAAPSECRTGAGYVCDADDTCWPGSGSVPPGGPCTSNDQCLGGDSAQCTRQAGFVGGYCNVVGCQQDSDCPGEGGVCRAVYQSGARGCVGGCARQADCRPGYACILDPASSWQGACFPFCAGDGDCPGAFGCRDEICVDVSSECTLANPRGDCAAGQVCRDGACRSFACDDTLGEPNETRSAAVPFPEDGATGYQICAGDDDWYEVTLTAADTLHLVGIAANRSWGVLKADLVDDAGRAYDEPAITADDYHEENPVGPTDLVVHSLVGAPDAAPRWLHVLGATGATTNEYTIVRRAVPWQDGPSCVDVYGQAECWARTAAGADDPTKLVLMPLGHAADPYIGEGVFFQNGLSYANGRTGYTANASLWGRRELVMAIRHAVHDVQQQFPGTTALGIGDIGMPDGSTPAGHPNGTHYDGANVDVSYFIRPDAQGPWGNMAYRVICCDKPISDWSCVDTTSSNINYGNCVPGSEETHIVDIPRTALFLARLVETGRIRGIGCDVRVEPDLEDGLDDLAAQGLITAATASAAKARLWSVEDDGSWLWHFNHLHVSFKTGATGKAAGGDEGRGPWPGRPVAGQAEAAREFYRAPRAR
jgi:hypothetical protein